MSACERARPGVHNLDRIIGVGFVVSDAPKQRLSIGRFAITLFILAAQIRVGTWPAFAGRPWVRRIGQRAQGTCFHRQKSALLRLGSRGNAALDQIELRLVQQDAGMPKSGPRRICRGLSGQRKAPGLDHQAPEKHHHASSKRGRLQQIHLDSPSTNQIFRNCIGAPCS